MRLPQPPFLIIERRVSFWIEHQSAEELRVHPQALRHGFLRDAVCLDSAGTGWPVLGHALARPPSLVGRLFDLNRHVRLELGPPAPAELRVLRDDLHAVLDESPGLVISLEEMGVAVDKLRQDVDDCDSADKLVGHLIALEKTTAW